MKLKDRNVVVTGAAQGIGAATAVAMAEAGAHVVCCDLLSCSETLARITSIGATGREERCDITQEDDVEALFVGVIDREGRIDHVLHSAGIVVESPLLDMPLADFDKVIAVNLRGTFLVGKAALGRMTSGSATFVSSNLGYIGRADHSAYVASKHGVMGLVRSWAEEFAPAIRVNALCPGPTNTAMVAPGVLSDKWRKKELELPLGRFAEPDEIARAALFLASDDASFVTGQGLGVNGGSVMA